MHVEGKKRRIKGNKSNNNNNNKEVREELAGGVDMPVLDFSWTRSKQSNRLSASQLAVPAFQRYCI